MIWNVFVIEAIIFAVLFMMILFASFHGEKMYRPADTPGHRLDDHDCGVDRY